MSGRPSAGAGAIGTLATVERPDGRHQVTVDGIPLYTFSLDSSPGQVTGDGVRDRFGGRSFEWHVVRPGASSTSGTGGSGPAGGGGY